MCRARAATATTATTLVVSAEGLPVATVAWGSVVSLTASVRAGGAAVTVGQVNFCDASAKYCTDIHLLGTAQLTGESATISFVPSIGTHSYKAIFAGARSADPSTSATATLKVAGPYPTISTIQVSGRKGDYELETTVAGVATTVPTGTIAYLDTSNAYALLGTAELAEGITAPLSFLQTDSVPAASGPRSVAIGDFNLDGLPDLAVTSLNGNKVLVLLGAGDGSFAPVGETPNTGAFPIAIAVADFNRDGLPDLAVLNNVNGGTGSVTVLLGNGDGTFNPASASPATGIDPNALASGDFNGDGIPDLAVLNNANGGMGSVSVLLGKGDGTFNAAASPAAGVNPSSIAIGDFNGDGIPDLAAANQGNGSAGTITLLLGSGDGTFKPASAIPTVGINPQSIAVADFNQDGKTDLAVVNNGAGGGHATLTILLGKGSASFTATTISLTSTQMYDSLAAGDFDRNGIPDLALSASGSSGQVTILEGNGTGGFAVATTAPSVGAFATNIAVADLDGDGKDDIASGENILLAMRLRTAHAVADEVAPIGGSAPHVVEAVYSGDNNDAPSISGTVSLLGEMLSPTVALKLSAASVVSGSPVSITCSVTGPLTVTGNMIAPTGVVVFYAGTVPLATVALNGSVSTYSTSALAIGKHIITAVYLGDTNYVAAVSAAIDLTVTPKPAASVTIKTSAGTILAGHAVTLTVTAAGSGARPTGAVTFYSGKALLATIELRQSGTAAWSTSQLEVGRNSIMARYSGDRNYAPAASKPITLVVTAP
jgi:hypothetical protein